MARVTIQDCLEKIENPFTLVEAASKRARKLAMGSSPHIPDEGHKPTVTALREIAEGLLNEDGELKSAYQEKLLGDEKENADITFEISRMLDEGDVTSSDQEYNASEATDDPSE